MKNKELSKKILIVDDEEEDLEIISKIIETMKYEPLAVNSIDKAITLIKKNLEYHLLIMDANMPAKNMGYSGRELLITISKGRNNEIPIILNSAWPVYYSMPNVEVIINKHDENYTSQIKEYIKKCLNLKKDS